MKVITITQWSNEFAHCKTSYKHDAQTSKQMCNPEISAALSDVWRTTPVSSTEKQASAYQRKIEW
jgi:hypothetical protein